MKGGNDKQWYRNIPNLLDDYAALNFGRAAGIGVNSVDTTMGSQLTGNLHYAVTTGSAFAPGIMSLYVMPVLGANADSGGSQSAVNIASQSLAAAVRSANSGTLTGDRTDYMMVVEAMSSAYMLYEILGRAYKTIGLYDPENRYLPTALMTAQGLNPAILETNVKDFKGMLDLFAYKLGSIDIPDIFDVIKRRIWLFSNVYKDADDAKAQLYLFAPSYLYRWVEGTDSLPTHLKPVDVLSQLQAATSIAELQQLIDSFMKPLLGSEDISDITGYFRRAFEGNLIKTEIFSDNEALVIAKNDEVLSEIENAVVLDLFNGANTTHHGTFGYMNVNTSGAETYGPCDIHPVLTDAKSGPYLIQQLQYTSKSGWGLGAGSWIKPVINMHWNKPNPDDVAVATRFTARASTKVGNGKNGYIDIHGTEVILGATIYSRGSSLYTLDTDLKPSNMKAEGLTTYEFASEVDITLGTTLPGSYDIPSVAPELLMGASFDWCPTRYMFSTISAEISGTEGGIIAYMGPVTDFDNYTVISNSDLMNIHEMCTMSLYETNKKGKIVG